MRRLSFPALALLALAACAPGEPLLRPVHRVVDAYENPATQTIDSETRYVLRGYPVRTSFQKRGVHLLSEQRVSVRDFATAEEEQAGRVVVVPHARLRGEGTWTAAKAILVPIQRRPGGRAFIEVEFPSPVVPGKKMQVYLEIYIPPSEPLWIERAPPVSIPANATLEFGVALPSAAGAGAPVELSIELCLAGDCDTVWSERLAPDSPALWQDHSVSLAAHAGRNVALRFRSHAVGSSDAFSFPLWADPTIYEQGTRREDELDIILISLDTVRADRMTSYGSERNTTPFIDEHLAGHGTLFESCVAPASTTGPSHMTLFTSLQPLVHGILPTTPGSALAGGVETLAELLRAHGFTTGAVTENGPMGVERGFGRGFGEFRENRHALRENPKFAIGKTMARGRRWLRRQKHKRVFLFLHTYEAHTPYRPPHQYRTAFRDQPYTSKAFVPYPDYWQPIRYDQELRYTDDQIAAFVRLLEAAGRLDNTLIVLTSDHGEAFLEHGFMFHGPDLHEEVLHVPLFIAGPGIPKGRRVADPVGLVDVMPTLLELAQAPKSVQATGRSLVSLLRGEASDVDWLRRPLFSEAWQSRATGRVKHVDQPTFSVRRGPNKLIRWRHQGGHRYALYDLAEDPGETVNRYTADPELAGQLQTLLDAYEPTSRELAQRLGEATGTDPDAPLDPEREEKLRALGYID